ncbi:hypothetical protein AB6B39_08045 [Algimonas porphyrae]
MSPQVHSNPVKADGRPVDLTIIGAGLSGLITAWRSSASTRG